MDSGWAAIFGGLVVGMIGITGTIISSRYAAAREAAQFKREYLCKRIERVREHFNVIFEAFDLKSEEITSLTNEQLAGFRAALRKAVIDLDYQFDEGMNKLLSDAPNPGKICTFLRAELRDIEHKLLQ